MLILFALAGAFLTAVVVGEDSLTGRKVQSAIGRQLALHALFALAVAWIMTIVYGSGGVTVLALWGGAFLSYFGVRSHIESSILLRMLVILRSGPLPAAEVVERYESTYAASERVEELVRGGLVQRDNNGNLTVSSKGRMILWVYRTLGGCKAYSRDHRKCLG